MPDKKVPKPGEPIGHPLGKATSADDNSAKKSLTEVIEAANEVKMALEDRKPLTAWKHTLTIQEFFIDTGMQFGIQSDDEDTPQFDKKEVKELESILKKCKTLAEGTKLKSKKNETEVEVQKFGDGVLLGKLLDLLTKLLPIFIK